MGMIDNLVLKIKRGESPFYSRLRSIAKAVLTSNFPVPSVLSPVLRTIFDLQSGTAEFFRWAFSYFIREPIFRARCASVGKRFRLFRMPYVVGHTEIHLGDDVNFFGKVDIMSGRIFDHPRLILHNRVDIGHNVGFVVNREIIIEDDVNVASGVRFMDSDAHPKDTQARIADLPPKPEEIKPVRICKNAWIGQNVFILKGVTVGEGAIIGVNSVVITDIPAYSVAIGNPARVVAKNLDKPTVAPQETPTVSVA